MKILAAVVLALASSTAHGAPADADADVGDERPTLFVFDNGTVCTATPCDRFTVVTQAGVTIDVSAVIGSDGVALDVGHGLQVVGGFGLGGPAGTQLLVDDVVGAARRYGLGELASVCAPTVTCPPPAFWVRDPITTRVTTVDAIDLRGLTSMTEAEFAAEWADRHAQVLGFLAIDDAGTGLVGDVLYITEVM
jgi:hypothetical protein